MTSTPMDRIVSLAKRRGFIFPGSEIYGGLAGMWDYGPYGLALKNNLKSLWWKMFVEERDDVYGVDASILMNQKVWQASGHAEGFSDPMVACAECGGRFRADHLEDRTKCPQCGGKLGEERQFNMMFETFIGSIQNDEAKSYLRPETAQGIFTNFKNIRESMSPKLPFGIAQIGKAFRNEISPRDFIFRVREFEQMELEYFVRESEWEEHFEHWRSEMWRWIKAIGLSEESVHEADIPADDLAHYSKRTIDFEFDYPFGRKELYGLAYRTDFDLKAHKEKSGADLTYFDPQSGERFIPHVIEPSLGLDRTVLAVLLDAYREDELNGEVRTYLKLSPTIVPIKAAVFPLLKNKPDLVKKAREVHTALKKESAFGGAVAFDDNGNIGKRYRRQDEIGTPVCITIDFETLGEEDATNKDTVTVRDRDTGAQERVAISDLAKYIKDKIS